MSGVESPFPKSPPARPEKNRETRREGCRHRTMKKERGERRRRTLDMIRALLPSTAKEKRKDRIVKSKEGKEKKKKKKKKKGRSLFGVFLGTIRSLGASGKVGKLGPGKKKKERQWSSRVAMFALSSSPYVGGLAPAKRRKREES